MSQPPQPERLRPWQWPAVLSLDAVAVALCWQQVFARSGGSATGLASAVVLALSVWLVYTADRLFDVRNAPADRFVTARHRFAHRNAGVLWRLWWLLLATDIALALTCLEPGQLSRGGVLLAASLLYTLGNRLFSRRFFPKELLVALIFSGGCVVFLPASSSAGLGSGLVLFAALCLANCLIIGRLERAVDERMRVRSLAALASRRTIASLLAAVGVTAALVADGGLAVPLTTGAGLLLGVTLLEECWSPAAGRLAADLALVLAAATAFAG